MSWGARIALPRRFLVVAALMFWQGGFTFYAAVVAPIGQATVGGMEQALITRRVTIWLNVAGAVALLPLAWDAAAGGGARVRRLRWLTLAGMAATLGLLFWLHPRLDALIDPEAVRIADRSTFHSGHRWYLWVSTVQWACAVAYTVLMLRAWRAADGGGA